MRIVGSSRLIGALAVIGVVMGGSCPKDVGPDEVLPVKGEHLLRFVHMSDPQVVDQESPARLVRFAPFSISAWRPQEAYTVQTLDATLRVINEYGSGKDGKTLPIDFVIITGDLSDGCQHNELRWFLDTMDGEDVCVDSGALDGIFRAGDSLDNPTIVYDAEGLDSSIPWYTVFGNHDGLASGIFGIDRDAADPRDWFAPLFGPVAGLVGMHQQNPPSNELLPTGDFSPAIITADTDLADPETLRLNVRQMQAGEIPDDGRRRFTSREEFIHKHFDTTSIPEGHGFTESNKVTGLARYSARPNPDVPVRIIVIDTVPPEPRPGFPSHFGVMTREQMEDFLKPEIKSAADAGEFVILASHHPSEDFDLPYPVESVGTQEFRNYLASQPAVIAHLCGHTHRNFVRRIDGANPYYEIETGSIIDYPQEARIIDIFYDEQRGEVGLRAKMISHMENPTRLSAESFRRAEIHASRFPLGKTLEQTELEAMGFVNWPEEPKGKSEYYGSESDRDFDLVIPRG